MTINSQRIEELLNEMDELQYEDMYTLIDDLREETRAVWRTLQERVARIDLLNAEADRLYEEVDTKDEELTNAVKAFASELRSEALELARMETPAFALGYVLSALARAAELGTLNFRTTGTDPDAMTLREVS